VIVAERRGPALLLGLDRPGKRNALSAAMIAELDAAVAGARAEPCVLVLHSTTPGLFAAGADIAELLDRTSADMLASTFVPFLDRLEAHRWPVIAAVDGPALGGGCELALACDLRLASPRARFGQPELALGIIASGGGNWRLPQAVGLPAARRMLYTGELLDAEAALAAGLVDGVLDTAVELAGRIAERSWRALELTKLALRAHRPATTSFDIAAQALLFDGADKRERMGGFLAERARRRSEGERRT
jgi:enoyl-CoA hydratase